jgi:hypothetical protein
VHRHPDPGLTQNAQQFFLHMLKFFSAGSDNSIVNCKDAVLTGNLTKDGSMFENLEAPTTIRRGRFLWLPEPARKAYVKNLRDKISKGYFSSESVIAQIVEELAPLYADSAAHE